MPTGRSAAAKKVHEGTKVVKAALMGSIMQVKEILLAKICHAGKIRRLWVLTRRKALGGRKPGRRAG